MASQDDDSGGPFSEYIPRPTDREYTIAPRLFIYCTNSGCPMVKTGGARCHTAGNNRPEYCKHCLCKFPSKPNGATFGFKHFELLQAGPDSRPRLGPARGGKGNGKGGKPFLAFNSQSYDRTPWRKESENRKLEDFRKSILGDMEKLLRGKGFVGDTAGPTPSEQRRPGLSDRWSATATAARRAAASAPANAGAAGNIDKPGDKKAPDQDPSGLCPSQERPLGSKGPSSKTGCASEREDRARALAATLSFNFVGNEEYVFGILDKRESDVASGAVLPLGAVVAATNVAAPQKPKATVVTQLAIDSYQHANRLHLEACSVLKNTTAELDAAVSEVQRLRKLVSEQETRASELLADLQSKSDTATSTMQAVAKLPVADNSAIETLQPLMDMFQAVGKHLQNFCKKHDGASADPELSAVEKLFSEFDKIKSGASAPGGETPINSTPTTSVSGSSGSEAGAGALAAPVTGSTDIDATEEMAVDVPGAKPKLHRPIENGSGEERAAVKARADSILAKGNLEDAADSDFSAGHDLHENDGSYRERSKSPSPGTGGKLQNGGNKQGG